MDIISVECAYAWSREKIPVLLEQLTSEPEFGVAQVSRASSVVTEPRVPDGKERRDAYPRK